MLDPLLLKLLNKLAPFLRHNLRPSTPFFPRNLKTPTEKKDWITPLLIGRSFLFSLDMVVPYTSSIGVLLVVAQDHVYTHPMTGHSVSCRVSALRGSRAQRSSVTVRDFCKKASIFLTIRAMKFCDSVVSLHAWPLKQAAVLHHGLQLGDLVVRVVGF